MGGDYNILVYWFCHRVFANDVHFIELLFHNSDLTDAIILNGCIGGGSGGAIIYIGCIM